MLGGRPRQERRDVGPARLETIAAYAAQQGFVPQGDELLGVYDGVPFTVNEAEATLAFVNAATFAFLRLPSCPSSSGGLASSTSFRFGGRGDDHSVGPSLDMPRRS